MTGQHCLLMCHELPLQTMTTKKTTTKKKTTTTTKKKTYESLHSRYCYGCHHGFGSCYRDYHLRDCHLDLVLHGCSLVSSQHLRVEVFGQHQRRLVWQLMDQANTQSKPRHVEPSRAMQCDHDRKKEVSQMIESLFLELQQAVHRCGTLTLPIDENDGHDDGTANKSSNNTTYYRHGDSNSSRRR
jgi:hypothetical protein